MLVERLAIIGVGLIGGSLALALRAASQLGEAVGCGRGRANLERAVELGIVDRFTDDPAAAVEGADMVVIAVPLSAVRGVLERLVDALPDDAVVTDVGSAKSGVIADARSALGARFPRFVPGHPVAGTEKSGADAAFAELFRSRRVILTPVAETDGGAYHRVADIWRAVGAEVYDMEAEAHDRILAATSHLPHMLAYTLVDCLRRRDDSATIFDYAAGGFADFTRIASSSPQMWHDIVMANRPAVLAALRAFQGDLDALVAMLERGDGERLRALFDDAKVARDRFQQRRNGPR